MCVQHERRPLGIDKRRGRRGHDERHAATHKGSRTEEGRRGGGVDDALLLRDEEGAGAGLGSKDGGLKEERHGRETRCGRRGKPSRQNSQVREAGSVNLQPPTRTSNKCLGCLWKH